MNELAFRVTGWFAGCRLIDVLVGMVDLWRLRCYWVVTQLLVCGSLVAPAPVFPSRSHASTSLDGGFLNCSCGQLWIMYKSP